MKPDDPNAEAMALEAEVLQLQNALQQGVRMLVETHPCGKWLTPPGEALAAAAADGVSLRAGINAGKADHGALVALLIRFNLFKLEDYQRARVQALRAEVTAYETVLAERMGQAVPLAVKPERQS